ncbi:acetyltransferase (GNAT) family protein [Agrobacterium vitis]|nr:acetyltransferase (GNAT) family protein [Agrobacterium vitis]
MSEITIEPMRPEYIESFWEALDSVARERRYLSLLQASPLDAVRTFVMGLMDNGNPQFVALVDERVVGWCDIQRGTRETQSHRGTLGMGIIDGYREQGLGLRLITTTLDAARNMGLHRVELDVHADNTRAARLYEKVGFEREGVARDAVLIDGHYIDLIKMAIIFPTSHRNSVN